MLVLEAEVSVPVEPINTLYQREKLNFTTIIELGFTAGRSVSWTDYLSEHDMISLSHYSSHIHR